MRKCEEKQINRLNTLKKNYRTTLLQTRHYLFKNSNHGRAELRK